MSDWISMEIDLHDHPKVRGIARRVGLSTDTVVGKLLRVWGWFDAVSVDGVVDACVDADVDDLARHDGFASAMTQVGWLAFDAGLQQIRMPGFEVHQGNSAKKRLMKSARQKRYRHAKTERSVDASVDARVDARVDAGVSSKATSTATATTSQPYIDTE